MLDNIYKPRSCKNYVVGFDWSDALKLLDLPLGHETTLIPLDVSSPSCLYVTLPKGLNLVTDVSEQLNQAGANMEKFIPKVRSWSLTFIVLVKRKKEENFRTFHCRKISPVQPNVPMEIGTDACAWNEKKKWPKFIH